MALGEDLALVADAGDRPEQERADVARDGRGQRVERLRAGADDGDGCFGVQGEKAQRVDHLDLGNEKWEVSLWVMQKGNGG